MARTQFNMRMNDERAQKFMAFSKKIGRVDSKCFDELLGIEQGVYDHRLFILDACHEEGGMIGGRKARDIFQNMRDTYIGEWEQARKRTFGVR